MSQDAISLLCTAHTLVIFTPSVRTQLVSWEPYKAKTQSPNLQQKLPAAGFHLEVCRDVSLKLVVKISSKEVMKEIRSILVVFLLKEIASTLSAKEQYFSIVIGQCPFQWECFCPTAKTTHRCKVIGMEISSPTPQQPWIYINREQMTCQKQDWWKRGTTVCSPPPSAPSVSKVFFRKHKGWSGGLFNLEKILERFCVPCG